MAKKETYRATPAPKLDTKSKYPSRPTNYLMHASPEPMAGRAVSPEPGSVLGISICVL